jgi:hypothetical protein
MSALDLWLVRVPESLVQKIFLEAAKIGFQRQFDKPLQCH